jgi:hypothetical protein
MDTTAQGILNALLKPTIMKIVTGLRQSTVSMVLQDWGKQKIQYVIDRIEGFIISSHLVDPKKT